MSTDDLWFIIQREKRIVAHQSLFDSEGTKDTLLSNSFKSRNHMAPIKVIIVELLLLFFWQTAITNFGFSFPLFQISLTFHRRMVQQTETESGELASEDQQSEKDSGSTQRLL